LHWPRKERIFIGPKIISVRQTIRPLFAFSDEPAYCDLSVNIIRHRQNDEDLLKALAAYLSSRRVREWLQLNGKMKGNIFQIDRGPLEKIPIPRDLFDRADLFESLLESFNKEHEKHEAATTKKTKSTKTSKIY